MGQRGKIMAAQDTCLCKISGALGVDLAPFGVIKEVDVFAPFLAGNGGSEDSWCAASFTSTVVKAMGGGQQQQMLTDGNVEFVLGMCLDYFDGVEIRPLNDRTMAMYYGLYLNALQQDLQCLAFAYRPLALDARGLSQLGWTGTDSQSVYVDIPQYNSASTVFSELGGGKKNEEEYEMEEEEEIANLPGHLTEAVRLGQLRSKTKFSQVSQNGDTGLDYTGASVQQFATEQEFLRDAVTEQIFLGLVTFAYSPKVDVCDFVEDLAVAGIRFVYFSRAKGRQSKAFAERLGLETDWNTCILLSSADDALRDDAAAGVGYVEDHDIKAQLPRGIASIRPHLRSVDDIPLQISLFAECTAATTREMITIFQENGDVVCCIGSALRDANTLTFAAADLAVGIEPIPHINGDDRSSPDQQLKG
ncbi:hypothetical protein IWW38_005729, partial [Coemansia aciculifera]